MRNSRALSQILLAAFAAGTISCGGSPAGSTDTTTAGDTTTAAPVDTGISATISDEELEKLGLDGYEFTIFMREPNSSWCCPDIFAAEENGEVLNDAVHARNIKLEERFGFTIKLGHSANASATELGTFILAGDDTYDMAFPMARTAAGVAQTGGLVDIAMLDYVDLDSSIWNKTFNDELNFGGKQFYVTGDISVNSFMAVRIMMFNKTLLTKYKLESPYELVKSGKWTMDKLGEMSAMAAADLNGDAKMDMNDQWGMVMQSSTAGLPMFYGAGLQTVEMVDSKPQITLDSERANNVFEKIQKLLSDASVYYVGADADVLEMFSNGKGLFFPEVMNVAHKLRSSEVDFGLVPAPKYEEKQDFYRAYADGWCISPAVIPVSAKDVERSGFVLQAIAEASTDTTRPAYYDVVLTGKSLRDEVSAAMLDIIFANFTLDNCDIYSWGSLTTIMRDTFGRAKNDTLATILAANTSALQAAIDKTVDAIEGLE